MPHTEPESLPQADFHLDDETLAAFVEKALETKRRERARQHLAACSHCFEQMARLRKSLSEREAMPRLSTPPDFVRKAKELVPADEVSVPLRQRMWDKIRSIRLPELKWRWKLVIPAAAAVAMILVIFIFLNQPAIRNYAMGGQLRIAEIDPLGFVGESDSVTFKGMQVELSADEKNLIFTWPEVAGAKFYHLDLIVNGEKQRLTPLQGIQTTSFSYPLKGIQLNTKYVWEISGKLEDGRSFQARAEFEIRK